MGETLNHYILKPVLDISKCILQRAVLSRQHFPSLDGAFSVELPQTEHTKTDFTHENALRHAILRFPPLRYASLGLGLQSEILWVSATPKQGETKTEKSNDLFGSVFVRTDLTRILFLSRRMFFRGFCCRISPSYCCGQKCSEKSGWKIPGRSSKICTTKIPDKFLQRGQAKVLADFR